MIGSYGLCRADKCRLCLSSSYSIFHVSLPSVFVTNFIRSLEIDDREVKEIRTISGIGQQFHDRRLICYGVVDDDIRFRRQRQNAWSN